jgi:Protein of unknown function (DUF3991)/Toprim-like
MSIDPELEAFKTQIELRQYAASLGFAYDKGKSSRRSAIMKRGGDKVVIKLNADDRHFVYFTVHDEQDNGSIIDFVMRRKGISNFGEVRKELRPWIGRPSLPLPALPKLEESSKDRGAVEAEFEGMKDALRHPYLENERGLPAALLASVRFKGCVRIDARRNAIFPHADQEGLCGFEKKNLNFTGFAKSGEKALWFSRCRKEDTGLVFCESGIEALSHAVLFPAPAGRYASIGGEMSGKQLDLIRAAALKMPPGAEIVAAFNADADGREYAGKVRAIVEGINRQDLRFTVHEPDGFKDWNDQLCGRPSPSFPTAHFELP